MASNLLAMAFILKETDKEILPPHEQLQKGHGPRRELCIRGCLSLRIRLDLPTNLIPSFSRIDFCDVG